jgi:hypothetical protein
VALADVSIMSHNLYEKTGFFACAAHTALFIAALFNQRRVCWVVFVMQEHVGQHSCRMIVFIS